MIHLKLIKGLSYTGDVKATAAKPDVFVKDEATAERLVASGFFAKLGRPVEEKAKEVTPEPEPEPEKTVEAEPEETKEPVEAKPVSKAAAGGTKKTTGKAKK